ncbi:hypothetical protein DNK59_31530, partial [Pseudomonas sp. TKO26]
MVALGGSAGGEAERVAGGVGRYAAEDGGAEGLVPRNNEWGVGVCGPAPVGMWRAGGGGVGRPPPFTPLAHAPAALVAVALGGLLFPVPGCPAGWVRGVVGGGAVPVLVWWG